MKLIVAGGRDFTNAACMLSILTSMNLPDDTELVSGMARGADLTAHRLWKAAAKIIHEFPADWATHGKAAGPIRNAKMAAFADQLVAFWDGRSRGTKHMIQTMRRLDKPVFIFSY